jgi:hypothetical protein
MTFSRKKKDTKTHLRPHQPPPHPPCPRPRGVEVGMGAAAEGGSGRRREKPGVGGTRRGSSCPHGKSADQGAASDPGRKRLLEINAQAVGSALGFGAPAPGARLQHEFTAGIERAKHRRALWVRARAVRPPGNDATTWHAAEDAEYPRACAAKAAFEQQTEHAKRWLVAPP